MTTTNPASSSLLKVSSSLTLPTLISRLTGFLKSLLLAAILGDAIASSFSVANQFPNFISELLLGAVLTAVIVPVLIQAQEEDVDKGITFLNKIYTLVLVVLGTATLLSILLAPLLSRIFLGEGKVSLRLTTIFAELLLPQIVFYGLSALFSAILNVHNSFLPAAWAPVVNNLIGLVTIAIYFLLPGNIDVSNPRFTNIKILVLGLGTTLGIVVQALMLIPFLKKNQINIHLKWGLDDRLKRFSSMALAIMLYVLISLGGLAVALRISNRAMAAGPAIYNYCWSILQLPYGVFGVAILTASMPTISRAIVKKDAPLLLKQLTTTIKITFVTLLPCVGILIGFGHEIGILLFSHGKFVEFGGLTGRAIAASAFTLIPYALLLINLRVLYAQQQAWNTILVILGITAVKIFFSYLILWFTTDANLIVIWQTVANGLGFLAGAIISYLLIRRALVGLPLKELSSTFLRTVAISALATIVVKTGLDHTIFKNLPLNDFKYLLLYLIINSILILVGIGLLQLLLPGKEKLLLKSALGKLVNRTISKP